MKNAVVWAQGKCSWVPAVSSAWFLSDLKNVRFCAELKTKYLEAKTNAILRIHLIQCNYDSHVVLHLVNKKLIEYD